MKHDPERLEYQLVYGRLEFRQIEKNRMWTGDQASGWYEHGDKRLVEVEVEVTWRPTVSRLISLGVRHPSGSRDQFYFLLEISFRQLEPCNFVAPSLGLARAVTLGSKSRWTHGHILLSHLRVPQPGGPDPRIYIPQEQGGPDITPGHWVPFLSPLTTRRAAVEVRLVCSRYSTSRCSWVSYRKVVTIVHSVLHSQGKATVEQVLQRTDAVRGGLQQGHNAGRVGRVEEDYGNEEHKEDDSGGHSVCL
jgi:hypothetical protein